jgi:hypothetical protein
MRPVYGAALALFDRDQSTVELIRHPRKDAVIAKPLLARPLFIGL